MPYRQDTSVTLNTPILPPVVTESLPDPVQEQSSRFDRLMQMGDVFTDQLGLSSTGAAIKGFGQNLKSAERYITGLEGDSPTLTRDIIDMMPDGNTKNDLLKIYEAGGVQNAVDIGKDSLSLYSSLDTLSGQFGTLDTPQKINAVVNTLHSGTSIANGFGAEITNVRDIPIPETNGSITVGGALHLMNTGINIKNLAENWDELNHIGRLLHGSNTVNGTIQSYQLFGKALGGANAASQTATAAATGAKAAATTSATTGATASGSTAASAGAAKAGASTATLANGGAGLSALQIFGGVTSIGAGAYTLYETYGTGGADGRKAGSIGGASVGVGVAILASGSLGVGLIAGAVFGAALGSIKNGKHGDQNVRDFKRDRWKELGFAGIDEASGKLSISLADGSSFDIGTDGDGNIRRWHDPTKRRVAEVERGVEELRTYDLDYTRDLDATTAGAGKALSMMLNGSFDDQDMQMANLITNGAVSQSGVDLTRENFEKAKNNYIAMYANAGINTKEEAYALVNQLQLDGRIKQADLLLAHQGINLVFDDFDSAYKDAQNLLEGVKLGRQG